mmetsp:Transcript_3069/g.7163  ORF Transcript_3069/g.7163 Transcript_3069/m.7163 type:complete len:179 (-) Transcript_3069:71-607(-)
MWSHLQTQAKRTCSLKTAIPAPWAEGRRRPKFLGLYGLSSWCYSVLGVYIIIYRHAGQQSVFGPPQVCLVDGTLLLVQGCASFGCDVLTFGFASWWKPFDRILAILLGMWLAVKPILVVMSPAQILTYYGVGAAAVFCKLRSETALRGLHWGGFLAWHTYWHTVAPMGLLLWSLYFAR